MIKRALYLLHAHPLGHCDNTAVAFHRGYQGKANTCKEPEEDNSCVLPCSSIMLVISPGLHGLFTRYAIPCEVPVLPEVGSMIVSPGLRIPALSASSTIRRPILSFMLPPALKYSHLATKHSHVKRVATLCKGC